MVTLTATESLHNRLVVEYYPQRLRIFAKLDIAPSCKLYSECVLSSSKYVNLTEERVLLLWASIEIISRR